MPGHSDALARDFRAAVDGPRLETSLDRQHGGDIDAWARSVGVEAREFLDFSASINPLGPPPLARKAFIASYREISRYPEPYGVKLKEALATRHGLSATEILLGNGSTQLIYLVCAALRPKRALIVGPAFSEYGHALTLSGTTIQQFSLNVDDGFVFSFQRLMAAWGGDLDIVFLTTPNSFTGQLISKPQIEEIAGIASARKTPVVIDEAFVDFVEDESVKMLVRDNPYLIVLRSLTKYFALPGLRLGYLLGQARRVEQLALYQEPWSMNAPALNAAVACLEDAGFAMKTVRWLAKERNFLSRRLAALPGFHPFPSQANFLLVKIDRNDIDVLQLRSFLSRKKILIRTCDSVTGLGAEYFRVAVKRRTNHLRLLAALKEWTESTIG